MGGGSINNSSDRSDAARLRFVLTPIKIFGKQWVGNELNKRVEEGRAGVLSDLATPRRPGRVNGGRKTQVNELASSIMLRLHYIRPLDSSDGLVQTTTRLSKPPFIIIVHCLYY